MKRIVLYLLIPALAWGACTASIPASSNGWGNKANGAIDVTFWPSGPASSGTATMTVPVVNAGDLIVFSAWCFDVNSYGTGGCTPTGFTFGSQNPVQTGVTSLVDMGSSGTPGSGEGRFYYVLSAAATGNVTATWTIQQNMQQQLAYIEFQPSAGCRFTHDIDSAVGHVTNTNSITVPSFTPSSGDVAVNFTFSGTHVNSFGAPWSGLTWPGSLSNYLNRSVNFMGYDLSASGSALANNAGTINNTSIQGLLTSFSMTNCPTSTQAATCYFIAANGSDSNTGTDEAHPWAHAPGMPNCAGNCAAFGMPASGVGSYPGYGFIFRGGDTWHFGNSGATPYTGGTWVWHGSGSGTNCDTSDAPSPVRTSCVYIGVDPAWFSGASWTRPVMTNDNPASTTAVASCAYANVGGYSGGYDETFVIAGQTFVWLDNFEWAGQCNASSSQGGNIYIHERVPNSNLAQNVYSNNYAHGFTHLAFSCPGGLCESNEFLVVSVGSTIGPGNVCDGADSDPTSITCLTPGGGGWLVFDNVFANQAQMVANGCHVAHDNFWFGYTFSGDGVAHGNEYECNNSAPQNDSQGHAQPATTHNLFYNNVMGHNTSGTGGTIKLQLAVNSTYPYYVFNNVFYDQGSGNQLNWGGTGITLPTGSQYFFNNVFEAATSADIPSCYSGTTYANNHIIADGGTYFGGPGGCTTLNNVGMSHAAAVTQGYMANGTATSGNNAGITCANDTTPCAPASSSNATVGAGANEQAYCSALLASSDPVIQRAGAACQSDATDGCAYNSTTHRVTCPARAVLAHPGSGAWDAGAYQYQAGALNPPGMLSSGVRLARR